MTSPTGLRVYIAGPMSGLPDFNYPAFFAAEEALRSAGYEPVNPARTEGREGCSTWLDFMRAGIRDVASADGVALLDGWGDSRGAVVERDLARGLGLDVRPLADWLATGLCPHRCHHAEANVPCPGRVYVDLRGRAVKG